MVIVHSPVSCCASRSRHEMLVAVSEVRVASRAKRLAVLPACHQLPPLVVAGLCRLLASDWRCTGRHQQLSRAPETAAGWVASG